MYPMVHSAYSLFLKNSEDEEWERRFAEWSKPPGKTEQTRCDNAVSAIRNAIDRSPNLKHRSIKVFPQGSYRNLVNVKKDSDVDIGVMCYNSYMYRVPWGITAEQLGNYDGPATYRYAQFKNELEQALVDYFGSAAVKRGNKAIEVHETTYHVAADVVPLFEFRGYTKSGWYLAGVALQPDNGHRIENYPERLLPSWPYVLLHYENGVAKNTNTSRRFKSLVRIIKKLRNEMEDAGYAVANPIPSYLIECLVWNVADARFAGNSWIEIVRSVLYAIWSATKDDASCNQWWEVDNVQYLFCSQQPWSRQEAHAFVSKAWDLIGIS